MAEHQGERSGWPTSEDVIWLVRWVLRHGAAHVRVLHSGMRMPRAADEQAPEPAADELDAQALARMIKIARARNAKPIGVENATRVRAEDLDRVVDVKRLGRCLEEDRDHLPTDAVRYIERRMEALLGTGFMPTNREQVLAALNARCEKLKHSDTPDHAARKLVARLAGRSVSTLEKVQTWVRRRWPDFNPLRDPHWLLGLAVELESRPQLSTRGLLKFVLVDVLALPQSVFDAANTAHTEMLTPDPGVAPREVDGLGFSWLLDQLQAMFPAPRMSYFDPTRGAPEHVGLTEFLEYLLIVHGSDIRHDLPRRNPNMMGAFPDGDDDGPVKRYEPFLRALRHRQARKAAQEPVPGGERPAVDPIDEGHKAMIREFVKRSGIKLPAEIAEQL